MSELVLALAWAALLFCGAFAAGTLAAEWCFRRRRMQRPKEPTT